MSDITAYVRPVIIAGVVCLLIVGGVVGALVYFIASKFF